MDTAQLRMETTTQLLKTLKYNLPIYNKTKGDHTIAFCVLMPLLHLNYFDVYFII